MHIAIDFLLLASNLSVRDVNEHFYIPLPVILGFRALPSKRVRNEGPQIAGSFFLPPGL